MKYLFVLLNSSKRGPGQERDGVGSIPCPGANQLVVTLSI